MSSSASVSSSPYGFLVVRRGYRPGQADACAAALCQDRDDAWERAARLTVLAREMEADVVRLRERVAQLPPQTYETLGAGAVRLWELACEEADAVRVAARAEADAVVGVAEVEGARLREAARAYGDSVRAEADERVRTRLLAARAEADDVRVSARREVKEGRGEALSALREVRQRTAALLEEGEVEQGVRLEAVERAAVERASAAAVREAELVAQAEWELSAAKLAFAEAEEYAVRCEEEARGRAVEVVASARRVEEGVVRETERVLREHGERWDEVRGQMDCVRESLMALIGRAPTE